MYAEMIAEVTSVRGHEDDDFLSYFARPLGGGPLPGVVLIHYAAGWDD